MFVQQQLVERRNFENLVSSDIVGLVITIETEKMCILRDQQHDKSSVGMIFSSRRQLSRNEEHQESMRSVLSRSTYFSKTLVFVNLNLRRKASKPIVFVDG